VSDLISPPLDPAQATRRYRAMKTVDKRFRCNGCHAPLGRRAGDTLAVAGLHVVLTPTGANLTCPTCGAEKRWRPQTGRRAPGPPST